VPLYEYVCADCDEKFERYVRAWGEAVSCPGCESGSVEKQLSRFAMSAGPGSGSETAPPRGAGGSCCGGGCGCAH
jgi:putative FmdB family regulatory protein